MANTKTKQIQTRRTLSQRAVVVAFTCLATLMGGPVSAATTDVPIPAVPLQSGTPYPAPNIMFILDDSGSMTYAAMPVDVSSYSNLDDDIQDKSYIHNTLYYNPNTDYLPWKKADNTRYTGGTSYSAAYADTDLVGGSTINLADLENKDKEKVQTYFVPKAGATDLNDASQYDRYQIKSVGGSLRVLKQTSVATLRNDDIDVGERAWWYGTIVVPAGAASLQVDIWGGTGSREDADLYLRYGDKPTTDSYDRRSTSSNNSESITVSGPKAGTWHIGVYNAGSGGGDRSLYDEKLLAVATGYSYGTPTGRTEAAEMANFATWYSYHRTRMKVAKFAASEAFSQLGDNYRVGYDSIWNRTRGVTSNDSTAPATGPAYPIPTGVDEGLFKGANRAKWFEYLHKAQGSNGTPLHDALWRAGEYYESGAPWKSGTTADDISCRLSFSILTTDGYWNSRSQFGWGGYDASKYGGNSDGTKGSTINRPTGGAGGAFTYEPKLPYKDDRAGTLGDVAMHFWKRDLRTGLDNNVPTSPADEAFWQHMVTFGVAIGLAGELDPEQDLVDLTSGATKWPDPKLSETSGSASYASRIDDLFHAAVNSRGAFVSASDPEKFVSGLLSALTTISERPGSASNVTANSTSFTSDTRVYQASYTSGSWTGELTAYIATSAGIQTTPAWRGSTGIPADHTKRKIWTWSAALGKGATFPTAAQQSALDVSSRIGSEATGAQNAAYVAGDRSREVAKEGKLRNRTNVLGDIVNSSPIYVNDSGAMFVGANDGMLHAFDGDTGKELFAYVPGGVSMSDLATLSDPQYGQTVTHKYFVDGPIAVSAKSQTPGKNYLVGALGRGGRGVFGLDVTTPASFGIDNVLWEASSDSDMGMVMGDPLVVTLNDAANTKAVIVANGINSPAGSATLFVLDIATGAVIKEIQAGTAGANGLFAPRGWDNNGDGTVDQVYAGDLGGNLWKFDLSSASVTSWGVANAGKPMYRAVDNDGKAQPITAGLALARNPDNSDVWVFFGTGRFISIDDLNNKDVQTLYGIKDEGAVVKGRTKVGEYGDLVKREIVVVSDDKRVRGLEEWKRTLEPGKKGWFLDLDEPYDGERVVSGLRILGTTLVASSISPGTGASSCDAGGTGYINALDAFTGTSPSQVFFDINKDGAVDDEDKIKTMIDGKEVWLPAGSIDLGIGMPTRATIIDKLLVVGGSGGGLGSVTINPQGVGARRVSWREILRD